MATSRLNLTRDQLATFLKDHEQIKQFERLFATVDAIAPDFVNEVAISAGTAQATANDALALIEALENSLTADGAVIDAKATLALQELKKLKDQIELAVLHPAMPQLGTLSAYNEDNVRLIGFDTSPFPAVPNPAPTGTLYWDGNSTLGLQMSQSVLAKIAQSQFTYVKASSAITKGQLCKHTGAVGGSGVITAAPTSIGMTDPNQIVGVAAEDIPLNGFGFIQDSGDLRGFDTTGSSVGEVWADGDSLYYNPAFIGGLTKTKPSAPNLKSYVGEVINAGSGGSGSIYVRMFPGSVLGGTDSNVQFGTLADKDLIQYDSIAQYWKNVAPSTISIGTATNLAGGAAGSVPYQTGAGATTFLPIGTATQVLKVNAGATAPEWVSGAALSKVDDTNVTLTLSGSPATSLLAATSLTLGWTGTLAVSRGGTGTGTSFTPGSVVFAGASGVYSQDNANLFWDDANNRLGIGTATPGSTLDVAGALNVTGNAVLGDTATDTVNLAGYMGVGGSVAINNTGINCETLALSGTSQRGIRARTVGTSAATARIASFTAAPGTAAAAFTASEVVGYVALDSSRGAGSSITNQYGIKIDDQTRGANNFGLASAVSYDIGKWNIYANGTADNAFAGNVRIGSTTAPTFALDVTGVASVSSLIYCPLLIGGSGTTSSLQLRSTLGAGTTGADIVFQVGSNGATEAMRVLNSGNVGIGTTSTNGFWGSTNSNAHVQAAYSSIGTIIDTASKGLVLTNTDTTTGNYSSLVFGTRNLNGTGIAQGAIYSINGTRTAAFNAGELGFAYSDASGVLTEAMRINASGNVGIGTNVPSTKLDVNGNVSATGTVQAIAAATQDAVVLSGRAGGTGSYAVTLTPTTLTASRTVTLADGNTTLQAGTMAVTGSPLSQFAATTSAQLAGVISDETGSGSLVFATGPTIATPTITTSATCPLVIGGTGTTSTLRLRSTSGVGTTGADIIFQTGNNGATEAMRVLNSGNVGIGSASPGVKLDVAGTIRSATTTYPNYQYNASNRMAFGETAVPPNETGSVVQFGSGANTRNMVFAFSKTGVNTSFFGNSGTEMVIGSESTVPICFRTGLTYGSANIMASGSEAMRITSTGNVGIGASSNLSTLTVNGSFASKSPSTVNAATYTVAATDGSLRFTTTNCTVTLPAAASFPGRILYFNTITANSVTSAAANVIPLGSNTAGTAILAATAGKFAMIQSDGTNWITMMSN